MQRAKEIMTTNPHCCLPESTVYEAVSIMQDENCGVVPVLNREGGCVGIITDRDIALEVVLKRLDPDKTKLQDVMTHNPITCHPEDTMEDVLHKMESRMVRRIPVVDDSSRCVGIISEADVALKEEDRSKVSELVEAVSQ